MNEDELRARGVTILRAEKVFLKTHKIALTRYALTRGGGVLDIIPNHDVVEGVLFELLDSDRDKIDRKEGVTAHAYEPITVDVETEDGKVLNDILTYQVCRKEVPPTASQEYKDSVLKGACDHGLSEGYRTKLKEVLEKSKVV